MKYEFQEHLRVQSSTDPITITSLTRIDQNQLALIQKDTAIEPMLFDYLPWLKSMTALLRLYTEIVPGITELDSYREVVRHHARWLLEITHQLTTESKQACWLNLLNYIEHRNTLLNYLNNADNINPAD